MADAGGNLHVLFRATEYVFRLCQERHHPVTSKLKRLFHWNRITQCTIVIRRIPYCVRLACKGEGRGCLQDALIIRMNIGLSEISHLAGFCFRGNRMERHGIFPKRGEVQRILLHDCRTHRQGCIGRLCLRFSSAAQWPRRVRGPPKEGMATSTMSIPAISHWEKSALASQRSMCTALSPHCPPIRRATFPVPPVGQKSFPLPSSVSPPRQHSRRMSAASHVRAIPAD